MNKRNNEYLVDIFKTYNDVLKVLLAEVEATYSATPTLLFNEIRSSFDHIARTYRDGIEEYEIENQLKKAQSHIRRAIIDCYKFLNVFYQEKIVKFEKETRNIDLISIDNGRFYNEFKQNHELAIESLREAKKLEGIDTEAAFQKYQESYNYLYDINQLITENYKKVTYKIFRQSSVYISKILIWVIIALLSGIFLSSPVLKILKSIF